MFKRMMALALVFAMTSVEAKKVSMAEVHATLRPYFTVSKQGGLRGVSGLAGVVALNSIVARGVTHTDVKDSVLSGVTSLKDLPAAVKAQMGMPTFDGLKSKGSALLAVVKSPVKFAKGVVADMNPFGSYEVVNQSMIDLILLNATEKNARREELKRIEGILNADATAVAVDVDGEDTLNGQKAELRGLGLDIEEDSNQAAVDAVAPLVKSSFFAKKAGNKVLPLSESFGKTDRARSAMAYMTIVFAVYTAYNSYVDFMQARAAKKAAQEAAK